jgi:hypothetical protein
MGKAFVKALHQQDVDHGSLIDHQQVAIERIVFASLEPAGLGIDLEQPVRRLCLKSGRLGHALRRPSGRRAEQEFRALCGKNAKDCPENGGLSDARPPVITMTLEASATRIAAIWLSASERSILLSATTLPSVSSSSRPVRTRSSGNRVRDTSCVFLAGLYQAERGVAQRLRRLSAGALPWPSIDADKAIPWIEIYWGIHRATETLVLVPYSLGGLLAQAISTSQKGRSVTAPSVQLDIPEILANPSSPITISTSRTSAIKLTLNTSFLLFLISVKSFVRWAFSSLRLYGRSIRRQSGN